MSNMYLVWPDDERKGCRKSMRREGPYIDPLGSLRSWEGVSELAQFRSSKGSLRSRNKLLLIMEVAQSE